MEKYYSIAQIAEHLGVSKALAREKFKAYPGVLRIGERGRTGKRDYLTIRVPESAIQRYLEQNSVPENPTTKRPRREAAGVNA